MIDLEKQLLRFADVQHLRNAEDLRTRCVRPSMSVLWSDRHDRFR